jgi:benzodiazapine receptor
MRDAVKLISSIIVCLAVGFLGSLATRPAIPEWYAGLVKPAFNPPNWVFGPVWTVLYLLMGIALFLVWRLGLDTRGVKTAVVLFLVQLALNALWSWVFFGWHQLGWSFAVIVALWVFILLTMLRFFPLLKAAAWLLVPYLVWVSFASVLNFSIWRLNG